ncbi:MAG: glycogen synthase GlgA [Chromatiales bacterium]|jgi:starch synthase
MEQPKHWPEPDPAGLKILLASSEAQPLIKTGGLADVAGSLPRALRLLGHDVRLVLPAYPLAVERTEHVQKLAELEIPEHGTRCTLLRGMLPGTGVPVYLVDHPGAFGRAGNPYTGPDGHDWPDNAYRFALFCRAVVAVAMDRAGLDWAPGLVHTNDWQTGLVPPLLSLEPHRPATLFTIHNLAYQGVFDRQTFESLNLPPSLWSLSGLEFHEHLCFIKGGIAFADWVNAVSPTYAREICAPELGYGLEGLLRHRGERLAGVLNGIDYALWDPSHDPAIPQHYNAETFELKARNRTALQQRMGLPEREDALLFGYVGRLVEQKGVDLILGILPRLLSHPHTQLVMLGSGHAGLEAQLRDAAERHPDRVATRIGYDEGLSHLIEAGSDCFLMPSRFEPCGLNQLYSLRYGAVPIVRRTGGLADTVIDATPTNLLRGTATGFVFDHADVDGLWYAVERAIEFHQRPRVWWRRLAANGMRRDFSWTASARHYIELYERAIASPAPSPLG